MKEDKYFRNFNYKKKQSKVLLVLSKALLKS
jgi:hypothetical protein